MSLNQLKISVQLCKYKNKFIINNMYPLYLHDLAEVRNELPNKFGVFEEEDKYQTLEQQIPVFDIWWEKEDILYPYLIIVNEIPAGFALVSTAPYLVDDSQFMLNELFILRPFRGKGIGEYAVAEIFNQFKGKWMLFTTKSDSNLNTINFWHKTLFNYTKDNFIEEDKELPHFGYNKVFNFNNGAK